MDDFGDESVNEIACKCSAQSGKTLTLLALMAWIIANDPGPILWVTSSMQEAKKLAKSRLKPLLERCGPILDKIPQDRSLNLTTEIYFPGCPLIITGAESPASLQSTPFRYIILDEARSYPKGAVEMVSKRVRSFANNYKKIIISTPALEQDIVDRSFSNGNQNRWFVPCRKCGHEHEMLWGDPEKKGGLKWDKNEDTFPNGEWNFEELKKTIRYECWNEDCDEVYFDTAMDRKYPSRHGRWVPHNDNAPSNFRSYTWGALLPWWAAWDAQVVEFLNAISAMKFAEIAPLKDHINETRGESWTDKLQYGADEKFIEDRMVDYDPLEFIEWEERRIMSIDVQGKGGRHFVWVVRAWGYGGRSRKISNGIAWSVDEVKAEAETHKVAPDNVVIDSGNWTSEIYKYVVESGYRWKPMKGDDKEEYRVQGGSRIWNETQADPAIGLAQQGRLRPINLILFAKYGTLDRLTMMMQGIIGQWEITENEEEQYLLEVTAFDKRQTVDTRGQKSMEWYNKRSADHYSDCEQMQVVAASITGLLDHQALELTEQ